MKLIIISDLENTVSILYTEGSALSKSFVRKLLLAGRICYLENGKFMIAEFGRVNFREGRWLNLYSVTAQFCNIRNTKGLTMIYR